MNVIFISQWYPSPENPVSGIFVREHALAIAKFHQVSVIHVKGMRTEPSDGGWIASIKDGPLTTYTVTYPAGRIPKTTWLKRLQAVYRVVDSLLLASVKPEIIHANVYNTSDLAYLLQRRYQIPAVLTEHSTAYPRNLLKNIDKIKSRFCMNRLQLIMPVSKNLLTYIQRHGIFTPFFVIPNTVNTDIFYPGRTKFNQADGIPRVLVVASLTQIKGINYLLHALNQVKKEGKRFKVSIVGEGPEQSALTSLSESLELENEVSFLGSRTKSEVADLMRRADLLALTSLWDNQPVVLLEAMCSGLPVLASRVGGIPEVVSGEQGRLVTPGDIQDIALNLGHLLDNYSGYSSVQISAYARSRFNYEEVGKMISQAYNQVLGRYQRQ